MGKEPSAFFSAIQIDRPYKSAAMGASRFIEPTYFYGFLSSISSDKLSARGPRCIPYSPYSPSSLRTKKWSNVKVPLLSHTSTSNVRYIAFSMSFNENKLRTFTLPEMLNPIFFARKLLISFIFSAAKKSLPQELPF